MPNKPENPKAFPLPETHNYPWGNEGMTLRDYFAAAALQGLLANQEADLTRPAACADFAFASADAMLKVRES